MPTLGKKPVDPKNQALKLLSRREHSARELKRKLTARGVGNETKVKVVKNKLAPPFKIVHFEIMYGEGISREGELIDLGVDHGLVEKSGAWFAYDKERIGQGKDAAKQYLKDNPKVATKIEKDLRAKLMPAKPAPAKAANE